MIDTPEMKDMMREQTLKQISGVYESLIKELNLGKNEADWFRGLLVERQKGMNDRTLERARSVLSPTQYDEFRSFIKLRSGIQGAQTTTLQVIKQTEESRPGEP